MFDTPQTGYDSQHEIQVNSCIRQNDFPILQYVKISFIRTHIKICVDPEARILGLTPAATHTGCVILGNCLSCLVLNFLICKI